MATMKRVKEDPMPDETATSTDSTDAATETSIATDAPASNGAKRGRKPGATFAQPVYWTEAMDEELAAQILANDGANYSVIVTNLKSSPAFSAITPDLLTVSIVSNHLRNLLKNAKWVPFKVQLAVRQRGERKDHGGVIARLQERFPGKLVPVSA